MCTSEGFPRRVFPSASTEASVDSKRSGAVNFEWKLRISRALFTLGRRTGHDQGRRATAKGDEENEVQGLALEWVVEAIRRRH